jgi:hypothetical protein
LSYYYSHYVDLIFDRLLVLFRIILNKSAALIISHKILSRTRSYSPVRFLPLVSPYVLGNILCLQKHYTVAPVTKNNIIIIPAQPITNPGYATILFFVTSDVPANPAPTISII